MCVSCLLSKSVNKYLLQGDSDNSGSLAHNVESFLSSSNPETKNAIAACLEASQGKTNVKLLGFVLYMLCWSIVLIDLNLFA